MPSLMLPQAESLNPVKPLNSLQATPAGARTSSTQLCTLLLLWIKSLYERQCIVGLSLQADRARLAITLRCAGSVWKHLADRMGFGLRRSMMSLLATLTSPLTRGLVLLS